MYRPVPTPTRRALAVLAATGLALSACGGGDDGADADPPAPTAAPSADADGDDDAGAGDVVEIVMRDFEFVGVPDTVPAGTRLTVVNEAPTELHEVVAFRMPEGEEREVSELITLAPGELIEALGEPVAVLLAAPDGPEIAAVGDGVLTEPGRYALMCFIPTGADIDEYFAAAAEGDGPPQVDGGPPHFVHGMYAELVVEA